MEFAWSIFPGQMLTLAPAAAEPARPDRGGPQVAGMSDEDGGMPTGLPIRGGNDLRVQQRP